jgi:hypothetical protein
MKPSLALTAAAILLLAGCSWREDPQYSEIKYVVVDNGPGAPRPSATITAVVDEWGSLRTSSVASLKSWSRTYLNDELEMRPPVYLRVEITVPTAPLASGTTTAAGVEQLVDGGADFVAAGVHVGDVALNTGTGDTSVVYADPTTGVLTLTPGDSPFPAGGESYEVYRMVSITARAFGDGKKLAETTLGGWGSSPLTATVISENYTAP